MSEFRRKRVLIFFQESWISILQVFKRNELLFVVKITNIFITLKVIISQKQLKMFPSWRESFQSYDMDIYENSITKMVLLTLSTLHSIARLYRRNVTEISIPMKYVYGVVENKAEKLFTWAGISAFFMPAALLIEKFLFALDGPWIVLSSDTDYFAA